VRFADLDARGHLNNVAFLQFVEAARIAFLREVDPSYDPTRPSDDDTIVARTGIDYRAPVEFEEEIHTLVRASEVERNKARLDFEMRAARDGRLLAEAHNVVVGYSYASGEAAPLNEALHAGLRHRAGNGRGR
jgi:acyl-CoA thioester hydrolase